MTTGVFPFEGSLLLPGSRWLLPPHLFMALAVAGYAALPVLTLGLPLRYLASLTALPYFALWKVIALSRGRATGWVRTQREPAPRE